MGARSYSSMKRRGVLATGGSGGRSDIWNRFAGARSCSSMKRRGIFGIGRGVRRSSARVIRKIKSHWLYRGLDVDRKAAIHDMQIL